MRLAVVSDTHFGDDLCALVRPRPGGGTPEPGPAYAALRAAVGQVDYLVLLGDIIDLSVRECRGGREAAQRESPGTERLERTGDRRYRFKTRRFPFDGELVVLNLLIERLPLDEEPGYTGTVEVELAGLPDDVRSRYVQSFARWQA
jgi:hypothetical protein